jgi:hypothetical protein
MADVPSGLSHPHPKKKTRTNRITKLVLLHSLALCCQKRVFLSAKFVTLVMYSKAHLLYFLLRRRPVEARRDCLSS